MAADFRHEKEREAWGSVEKNGAFRSVVDAYQEISNDLGSFAIMKGRSFPVTRQTYPKLYRLYRIAAERVGVEDVVPLYLEMEYSLQTRTVGTDGDCAIIMSSACLTEYSDTQLMALLGYELAHIRYGHIRMLHIHEILDRLMGLLPVVGKLMAEGFKATLLQWRKYADMTADRGAAIAAGSADVVLQTLSQSMGREMDSQGISATLNSVPDEKNLELGAVGTAVFQIMMGVIQVPYGMWRMKALKQWCASENCRNSFPTVYYGTQSEFGLEGKTDGEALFRQYQVMRDENPERGLALLHAAANCGYASAQVELGRRYLDGNGLPVNVHEGLTLIRAAAMAAEPEGWYQLANCFAQGFGELLPCDAERAAWLYRAAAAAGHRAAGEKLSKTINTISPKSMESLLNWLVAHFSGGPAVLNEMEPAAGLNETCCPGIGDVRNFLWIPANETVYLTEFDMDQEGAVCRAVAVAATGVYAFDGEGLPAYLTWAQWKAAKVDAIQKKDSVILRLNKQPLCSYRIEPPERAVGILLVKICSALK